MLGELARRLEPQWDLTVVAPAASGAATHDASVPYAVKRTRFAWGGPRSAAVLAEMAMLTRRVQSHMVVAGHLLTIPSAITAGRDRALVAFLYGSELWAPKAQRVLRAFARRPSGYVAISQFTASIAALEGVPRERIEIVEPGAASLPRPEGWRERLGSLGLTTRYGNVVPFFLTLARLAEPHKGQDLIIRVLAPLLARHPDFRYVIAGDGPLQRSFRQVAQASGVESAVVFAGRVDETTKTALLAGCRALVMPSREAPAAAQFEGFGITYLEAALLGRPSIGGDAGAVPEVVVDGETGLLVDPRDSVALLEAMMRLADDPHLADELGARAQARAATFTWDRTANGVDEFLRKLM
jgi:phosphatidylinositol alpha-1,6-mannosyltransferase